ncbi:MAG: hypothetical protein QT00_C0002G0053 [archaeon GW2011_AR5]|nr:MAG: hypothetical protein QT00_C0002G0053 [archaeon GW2011_AR5]
MNFGEHVAYAIHAHTGQTRRWDNRTPYSIHPIWCATTILTETALPQDFRNDGALVLLYHDVKEDTEIKLPQDLPPRVLEWIDGMTFEGASVPGGSDIERAQIWGRPPEIRLFKLYDKTNNLLDVVWAPPERVAIYREYLRQLRADVISNYGEDLNIVRLSQAVLL